MDYATRLFQVESGGDPNARTGSYQGLAQLSPSEEAKYGINDQNRTDPALQRTAANGIAAANTPALTSALGRAPSPGELYLAHQQGIAGAPALLTGGDTPAWQAVRPYYKSDAMAQLAISGNLPKGSGLTVNSPASAFSNYWVNKFENGPQGALGNQGAPVADPNQDPQGALASQQVYGRGALQGGQPPAWQGPGGVGDTMQNVGAWLQAANNPGGAASLLQGLQAKQQQYMPKPMSMGTDPLTGKIKYGLFDPRTGTIRPMGTGAPAPQQTGSYAPDGSDFTDALQAHAAGKLDTPGLIQAAGPMVSQEAKALVEGTANPSNLGNRNPALRQGGLMLAHVLDPNFNENQIPARVQANKSLLSQAQGTLGGTITNAGTVADHAASYMENARKLQAMQWADGSSNDANWLQNLMKSHSTDTGFKAIVNAMNADADFLAGEGVKSATGGPGAMSDRAQLRQTLDVSKSLPEKQAAAGAILDLMKGRLTPAVNNYNQAFGLNGTPKERSPESFLPKSVLDKMESVMSTTAPQSQAQAAPGAPAQGAPQAAPAATAASPLAAARAAIAKGAPRDAVIKRLQQNGIDPGGL
jgi:hypothetical protein